jgi:hypothetical protein
VHGEDSQVSAFAETLKQLKPSAKVLAPDYQETVEI